MACRFLTAAFLSGIRFRRHRAPVCLVVIVGLFTGDAWAAVGQSVTDPLDSPMWDEMHQRLLGGHAVVFDERVRVIAPVSAENSLNVPVKIDDSAIADVQRIVVFADLNPIPRILEFEPMQARPVISLNFKVQQATPLRAAVLDGNQVWRVGGVLLDASGGGCTQPSVGSAESDWADQLGAVSARLWRRDKGQRVRLRIMHPMDTGLAASIPVFYIERVEISNPAGEPLALIHLYEPVAENPTLSVDLPGQIAAQGVRLFARDNNGNRVSAQVSP